MFMRSYSVLSFENEEEKLKEAGQKIFCEYQVPDYEKIK